MLLRVLVICLSFIVPSVWAGNETGSFYQRYNNERTIINESLKNAREQQQLVALVLGAAWCHDSNALAGYFSAPELSAISNSITLLPVDVGYLENKQSLLSQFGYPVYFATPTLLLIDPGSGQVINRDTLPIWQSAHNESAAALTDYLQAQLDFWQTDWHPSDSAEDVAEFEQQQAILLYDHYQQLGKLLALENSGGSAPSLNTQWRAVKQYRMALQADLIKFHRQGEIGDKTPNYAPIVW